MTILKIEQEKTKHLVKKAKYGDPDAFMELERLSKPLMVHLADYYSNLHMKFEYDDFYAICRNALYEACIEYSPDNPSFLSYAKTFMVNQCNRELEYWNAEMRNIFKIQEVFVGLERDIDTRYSIIAMITVEDEAYQHQCRANLESIISSLFSDDKAKIIRMYLFNDLTPRHISDIMSMKYHNVYSTIRRGLERIEEEYKIRYTLDKSTNI